MYKRSIKPVMLAVDNRSFRHKPFVLVSFLSRFVCFSVFIRFEFRWVFGTLSRIVSNARKKFFPSRNSERRFPNPMRYCVV